MSENSCPPPPPHTLGGPHNICDPHVSAACGQVVRMVTRWSGRDPHSAPDRWQHYTPHGHRSQNKQPDTILLFCFSKPIRLVKGGVGFVIVRLEAINPPVSTH